MVADVEWAKRPCSEEWTLHRRPCPWFKAGKQCQQTWGDLVAPYNYFVIIAAWFNVMVASALIWDAALRRDACAVQYHGYTPYQRLLYLTALGFVALGVASLDANGGNKILGPEWRQGFQCTIRVLIEIALIEVGDAYNRALRCLKARPASTAEAVEVPREPSGSQVAGKAAFAALYSIIVGTWEVASVPRRGRAGCIRTIPNTMRNAGTASIEISFYLWTYANAREARTSIANKLKHQPTAQLVADQRLVDTLTTHIAALCLCLLSVFAFALYVVFRNYAAGPFLCEQPACTSAAYPWRFAWAIGYHICVWIIVLAMVPNRLATRVNKFLASFVPSCDPADLPAISLMPPFKFKLPSSPEASSSDSQQQQQQTETTPSSGDAGAARTPRTRARAFLLDAEDTKVDDDPRPTSAPIQAHELRAACVLS